MCIVCIGKLTCAEIMPLLLAGHGSPMLLLKDAPEEIGCRVHRWMFSYTPVSTFKVPELKSPAPHPLPYSPIGDEVKLILLPLEAVIDWQRLYQAQQSRGNVTGWVYPNLLQFLSFVLPVVVPWDWWIMIVPWDCLVMQLNWCLSHQNLSRGVCSTKSYFSVLIKLV